MKTSRAFTLHRLFAAACVASMILSPLRVKEWEFHEPPLPVIPKRTFPITEHGAKGDNASDNAKAIQSAIEACAKAGGGTVIVPPGDYLCGPIQLASHMNLREEKGATLRMLPLESYPAVW